MKTINKSEYNALPEERKRFFKMCGTELCSGWGTDNYTLIYTPIQINLEDAERVLEEAREEIKSLQSGYSILDERFDIYDPPINILTAALNNLKQLTK